MLVSDLEIFLKKKKKKKRQYGRVRYENFLEDKKQRLVESIMQK